MLVYDDDGNMHNTQVTEFAEKLDRYVSDFLQELFDQGMTVLECRALLGHLKSQLSYTAVFRMLDAQFKKESEKDDSSGPDNGASTARDE